MKKKKRYYYYPAFITDIIQNAILKINTCTNYSMCNAIKDVLREAYQRKGRDINVEGMMKSRFNNDETKEKFKRFVEKNYPWAVNMVTTDRMYWLHHGTITDKYYHERFARIRIAFLQLLFDETTRRYARKKKYITVDILEEAIDFLDKGRYMYMCTPIRKIISEKYKNCSFPFTTIMNMEFKTLEIKEKFDKFVRKYYPEYSDAITTNEVYWLDIKWENKREYREKFREIRIAFLKSLLEEADSIKNKKSD